MLEIANLSVQAGSFLLSNVSLKVLPSSCHVILGPTGSGKTLLLESVIGLRDPKEGKIVLEHRDITGLPMEKRKLSYVPQDLALFPHMTVRENILYPLKIRGAHQDTETGIVRELIDSLNIRSLLDRRIANLSGGERQRTALVRAILSGGKYLVLDEPLSALHESLKTELWYLLKDLKRRYDLAILMVTHDLEEAFFLGDTISVIMDGKLLQQAEKREVYRRPHSEEVARFLGISNIFRGKIESINDDSLAVRCEELGVTLDLSTQWRKLIVRPNEDVIFGIRSEDVLIPTSGEFMSSATNIIKGIVIDHFETGASHIVIASCGSRSKNIEIALRCRTAKELKLATGQPILVRAPEESLFLIVPPS
jgi:ABC-type sugar transport system ATPase subunit